MSHHNGITVGFDGCTATVFGRQRQEQTFSVAVKSYPTPALFGWPPGFKQAGGVRALSGDITTATVTVIVEHDAVHQVTVSSGPGGLSSQIAIQLILKGDIRVLL